MGNKLKNFATKPMAIRHLLAVIFVIAWAVASLLTTSEIPAALFQMTVFFCFLTAITRFLVGGLPKKNSHLAFGVFGGIYFLFTFIPDSDGNSPRQESNELTTLMIWEIWEWIIVDSNEFDENDVVQEDPFRKSTTPNLSSSQDKGSGHEHRSSGIRNLSLIVHSGGAHFKELRNRRERLFQVFHCLFSLVFGVFGQVLTFTSLRNEMTEKQRGQDSLI